MTPDDVERLSRLAAMAGITELDLAAGGDALRLRLWAAAPGEEGAAMQEADPVPRAHGPVRAPYIGLFRSVHPVTGLAPAEVGREVKAGQIVAYLQAGPCLRGVVAAQQGILGKALVGEGALVGFGTPLFSPP